MIDRVLHRGMLLVLGLALLAPPAANAQNLFEYGDAPEEALAYPWLSVVGMFPTCLTTGPADWVRHVPTDVPFAWFGPATAAIDYETDGNAGLCFPPPYDEDECFQDGDAGLITPDPYTIVGGLPVPCPGGVDPSFLGPACTLASWGTHIDIEVHNATDLTVYVNVIIDWDASGSWGGAVPCGVAGSAVEHVLQNFPVPALFSGPLSLLSPPAFLIGPRDEYAWARFTVSPGMVDPTDYDGSGPKDSPTGIVDYTWDFGETEDYLLRVGREDPTPIESTTWGRIKNQFR